MDVLIVFPVLIGFSFIVLVLSLLSFMRSKKEIINYLRARNIQDEWELYY